jgi:ABC-type glycerol-3-phosphate transport system permease component
MKSANTSGQATVASARGVRVNRSRLLAAHSLLLATVGVMLVPFIWLFCASLRPTEVFFQDLFLPTRDGQVSLDLLTFASYQRLFSLAGFARSLLNSVFLASTTALLGTLVAAMGGYALARFHFKGSKFCTALVLAAVTIPGPLLMAPGYQFLYRLGLLDSFWGVILPAIAPAFGVFLFRQAILSAVPRELLEAARLDGSGEFNTFFMLVLPLLRPMVATFLMILFLGSWNNFVGPQIVLQTPEKFPLAVAIAQLKSTYYQDYGLQMAGTVVSILPVLALFAFLQKEFVDGLAAGAIKE